jgi:peptidoglycan hydrolase FlgJ
MALRIDSNPVPVADQATQPVHAHDFKQFAALRRGADANDPATLREVARQFESIFTKMMLDSMRSASFGDPLFGSDQTDMYQDMMDDQMAVQLSSGRGIGLADMLIRQLSQGRLAGAMSGSASEAARAGARQPEAAIDEAQRRRFIAELQPHAEAAARELGVDARHVIAQAALESRWGTARPADGHGDSHNFFGIKAGSAWQGPSVTAQTTEFVAGEARREGAAFRSYQDLAENVRDYVRLLRDNPRYAGVLNTGADARAFAAGLQQGGYATDPDYADKIVSLTAQIGELTAGESTPGDSSPGHGSAGPWRPAAVDGRHSVNPFKSAAPGPLTEPVPSKVNSNG